MTIPPLNRPVSCSHIYQPTSKTEITVGGLLLYVVEKSSSRLHIRHGSIFILRATIIKRNIDRFILILIFSNLSYVYHHTSIWKIQAPMRPVFHWWVFFEKFGILFSRLLFYVHTRVDTILPWCRSIQLSPPPCVASRMQVPPRSADEMEKHKGVYIHYTLRGYIPHHHPTIPSLLYAVHRKLLLDVHP